MKIRLIAALSLLPAFCLPLAGQAQTTEETFLAAAGALGVTPAAQEWKAQAGTFTPPKAGLVVAVDARHAKTLAATAQVVTEDLAAMGFSRVTVLDAAAPVSGGLFLTLDGAPEGHGPGAHALEIADGAVLRGASPAGVLYASRTLLQLQQKSPAIPCGTVRDWPDTRGRMLMLDVARKPHPIPVLKDYIRMMAWYKMNELHLHFTDESRGDRYPAFRIESKKFPGLHSKDLFYTWEDLRDLQDFAKVRGVVIIPEVDMPGHARSLVRYWPELRHPKLPESNLDITNPKTAETMKALLDEMIPLFDAPDFHIGTDEYNMSGLPAVEKEPVGKAFTKFTNEMAAYVRSKGKNCRIWSGWTHMPGTTDPDSSVVIDMWLGCNAKELIKKGHKVINSRDGRTYIVPGAHYYGVSNAAIYANWHPWTFGSAADNPDKNDPNLLGGKLHVWNDQGPAGYTMMEIADATYPSLRVFSEKMWGVKGSKDLAEFEKRAALTAAVPGVTVFNRMQGGSREEGVFYSRPAETTLADTDSIVYLPWAVAPRADLEYPWTLIMEIQKTAGNDTRGVILASDLVEICADFKRTENRKTHKKDKNGKPIVEKVERHGIGLIRASGAFGKDPLDSIKALEQTAAVCSEPIPLGEWVTLAVVAERGKTTVYLNGKKAGETNNQMVCPLRHLGSKTRNSFVGRIRNLHVFDRALPVTEFDTARKVK